jgi:hypothetical protein
VTGKIRECDYQVQVGNKEKIFHANLLKRYFRRQTAATAAIVIEEGEQEDDNVGSNENDLHVMQCKSEAGIALPSLSAKESYSDVSIAETLDENKKREIKATIKANKRIFPAFCGH